jgi:tetratricopeptide (TPR) repeat protein
MITGTPDDAKRLGAAADPRIPLSLDEAWRRMRLTGEARPPAEVLGAATARQLVLQDFRPLASSLEWELSRLHWQLAGTLPFAENEVPFLINNTGRLSEDAAALLFHNCVEAPPSGRLVVLELGAGCGLFARLFLDAFRTLCSQEGADYFDRLTYVVSDGSPRSVGDWSSRGVFSGFDAHVVPLALRADDAACAAAVTAALPAGAAAVRGIFCNYVLDVLPSRVIRRSGDGCIEEMHVRTVLSADAALLREYTRLTVGDIQRKASSASEADLAELIPLTPLFDVEVAFQAVGAHSAYLEQALCAAGAADAILVNDGALECLQRLRHLVDRNGFVLVNDYGPTEAGESRDYGGSQRFGRTTAHAINFPVFDALASADWILSVPDQDRERSIHSRLLAAGGLPGTRAAFLDRFSAAAQQHFERPLAEARDHAAAGRKHDALAAFRTAIARSPRDWRVLGEAAEFVGLDLRDFSSGAELARAAVEINPWYSTWLWNVLGDCLYCLERHGDAHEAYLQAQRINPRDPRTMLNLGYTWVYLGNYDEALRAIATGLAADAGAYRARLLEKQNGIIAAADLRRSLEYERLAQAARRMRPAPAAAATAPATT